MLAQLLVARGINASPEGITDRGKQKPDVIIGFRGARCIIEGKIEDVQDAKNIVRSDAKGRVETGIAQVAVAAVYPRALRSTPFVKLADALATAELEFCFVTEQNDTDWEHGTVDSILSELRRVHEMLSSDDVVRQAADELSGRLKEVANLLMADRVTASRLVDLLGIGEEESSDDDSD